MNLLLDTHLLLWSAARNNLMSKRADVLIKDPENTLWFSAASIWEVAIKRALNRADFRTDPGILRAGLLSNGYQELAIEGHHCLHLTTLPPHHGDPFDRILVAQAIGEGMTLLTADKQVSRYPGSIELI